MLKQTPKRVPFKHTLSRYALGGFVVLAILGLLLPVYSYTRERLQPTRAYAATGINHQINFQGKLVNPDGTNVTDGNYSIVFSIYTVASGGSAIWTETQGTVALSNGIFQVALGSVTALPGSVDFNTDNIYLGIKVGADAEMTPRIQFTAVPQAFNAEKLGGLDKTGFVQNQNASAQTSTNFWVSGTGRTDTSFTTPLLQSAAAAALTITANAASTWSTSSGLLTIQGATGVTINSANGTTSSNITLQSGNASAGAAGNVSIDTGTFTSGTPTINIGTANAGAVSISKTGVTTTVNGALAVTQGATFNGLVTANTNVNFTFNGTENFAITSDLAGSLSVMNIVATPSATAGSARGILIQQANSANVNGIDDALMFDNNDTDLAVTNGITFTGSGAGFTNFLNTPSIDITGAGAVTGATGISSSGTIAFGGLSTNGFVKTTGGTGTLSASSSVGLGSSDVSGTLGVANGGTGVTSYTIGDMLYASGATTLSKLAAVATGNCLISQGTGTAPAWGSCGTAGAYPAFSVHKNGTNQTVTTSTIVKMTWNTELFDTNANFDSTTNHRFTPTVPGKYIITGRVGCTDNTGPCIPYIYKNGVAYAQGTYAQSGGTGVIGEATAVIDMNGTTDYLELYGYNSGGTTISGAASQTTFSGSLVSANGNSGITGSGTNNQVAYFNGTGTITSSANLLFNGTTLTANTLSVSTGGAAITGNSTIATAAGNTLGLGNSTGTLTVTGNSSSTFVINGVTIDATEFGRLDAKDAALVDINDAVATAITGTGALNAGSITSGFGTINTGTDAITGGTLTVTSATANTDTLALSVGAAGAGNVFGGTITNADLTAARTWTLPDATGTFITTGNLTGITATGTITSGTWNGTAIGAAYGGTGLTSYTVGDLLYASGATTLGKLADVATGSCLMSGGVGAAPTWGTCSGTGDILQNGNSFATTMTIGTNDAQNLVLETNNTARLTVGSAGGITVNSVGTAASMLTLAATGSQSSMEFRLGTSSGNTFIGNNSGASAGASALGDTAVGYHALQSVNSGQYNSAFGYAALQAVTSGSFNAAFGNAAGQSNTTGDNNTFIGTAAGLNTTSSGNAFVGSSAGHDLTGANNTALGYQAGYVDSGGNFLTVANIQNAAAIGAYAQVQASNSIVLGSVDTSTYVGIGTTIPLNTFSVMPLQYSTGTISQSASATVVGVGTTFTAAMVGSQLIYADGTMDIISAFTDATHITVGTSRTHASSTYRIHYQGLQVTQTGNMTLSGTATIDGSTRVGSLYVGPDTSTNVYIQGGANNHAIEIGKQNGTTSTPYIDFHSGATAVDYDTRLVASGGSGTAGGGYLTFTGNRFNPSNDGVTYFGDSTHNWNTAYVQKITNSNGLLDIQAGPSGAITFSPNNGVEAGRFTSAGKFGIGTTAPGSALEVRDSVTAGFVAEIINTTTSGANPNILKLQYTGFFCDNSNSPALTAANDYIAMWSRGDNYIGGVSAVASSAACNSGTHLQYKTNGADYAEYFLTNPANKPAARELVSFKSGSQDRVTERATDPNLPIVGAVTETAGFVGNGPSCTGVTEETLPECVGDYQELNSLVSLVGQVKVKVNNSNGAIHVGDPIGLSSTPGIGARLSGSGYIVGYAIEGLSADSGEITVLIRPSFYTAPIGDTLQGTNLSISGDAAINGSLAVGGSLNVSGASTLASLVVTGDVTVQGSLTVVGDIETRNITVNGHIITAGNAPTVTVGVAAGQADQNQPDPAIVIDGNDSAGTVSITTGSQNLANGVLAHVSFAEAFNDSYKVVLSASNDPAGLLRVHTIKTAGGFDIVANDTVTAITQYNFDYIVVGAKQAP